MLQTGKTWFNDAGRVAAWVAIVAVALGLVGLPAHASGARPDFLLPVPCGSTWRLSTYDSWTDPSTGKVYYHKEAVDLNLASGEDRGLRVLAAAGGTVTLANASTGAVTIDHGAGWVTKYLHMSPVAVSQGQTVVPGQRIGNVGSVGVGTVLNRVILLGSDYYESLESIRAHEQIGRPRIGIGTNCRIQNTIVDKNARIGDNVVISPDGKPEKVDHANYYIRDGIVIIPKNGVIPHGTVI